MSKKPCYYLSVIFRYSILSALFLALATFLHGAESPPTFELKWGTEGSGNGQFSAPGGVAVDSSGNVYVADIFNNRIQKFDSSGNFLLKWGAYGFGDGQFRDPTDVAVDSSGNVYVVDRNNTRIHKFDSSGNFILKFGSCPADSKCDEDGQLHIPNGLAVDSSGNVYVADTNNHRIQKFDSSGNFLFKWGAYGGEGGVTSNGSGDGQFSAPQDVAVDGSGNVYVAESGNNRIQKFDSSGNFLLKWGTPGFGDGQFNQPSGVAVDSSGNVYVADKFNDRIQKFDSSGNFLLTWGTFGSGDGQFDGPQNVAVDSFGNVYVADRRNNRIQKFSVTVLVEHPLVPGGSARLVNDGTEFQGNTYNGFEMIEPSATFSSVAGEITRISFLDPDGDLVFAEFGSEDPATTLTIELSEAELERDSPYDQPTVKYLQGLAFFTIENPTAITFFSVFTSGNDSTRVDPSLIKEDTFSGSVDGIADVGGIVISVPEGETREMGGINAANANFVGSDAAIGILADRVVFRQFLFVGDITPSGTAAPAIRIDPDSSVTAILINGGDLAEATGSLQIDTAGAVYLFPILATDGWRSITNSSLRPDLGDGVLPPVADTFVADVDAYFFTDGQNADLKDSMESD